MSQLHTEESAHRFPTSSSKEQVSPVSLTKSPQLPCDNSAANSLLCNMLINTPKTLLDFNINPPSTDAEYRKTPGDQTRQQFVMHNAEVIRDVFCMLNSLCGPASLPGAIGNSLLTTSFATNAQKIRDVEQISSESPVSAPLSSLSEGKAKPSENLRPVNLTRHHLQAFDTDLVYSESMTTKGQFVCPNCSEDFLNRDALAMHMMESVHSEACVNSSKENRHSKKLTNMAVTASKAPAPVSPTGISCSRKYFRFPGPLASSSIAISSNPSLPSRCRIANGGGISMPVPDVFHSLLQSFVKVSKPIPMNSHPITSSSSSSSSSSSTTCVASVTSSNPFKKMHHTVEKPITVSSISRPGRKPRRLLPQREYRQSMSPLQISVKPFDFSAMRLYKNTATSTPENNSHAEKLQLSPGIKRHCCVLNSDILGSMQKRPNSCEPDRENQMQPERVQSAPNTFESIEIFHRSGMHEREIDILNHLKDGPKVEQFLHQMNSQLDKQLANNHFKIEKNKVDGDMKKKEEETDVFVVTSQRRQTPCLVGEPTPKTFPYTCIHCQIGFCNQTLFGLHMGLHTSANPWQCNMCSKLFANVYEFTAHTFHY